MLDGKKPIAACGADSDVQTVMWTDREVVMNRFGAPAGHSVTGKRWWLKIAAEFYILKKYFPLVHPWQPSDVEMANWK
jgi:hypothetical protein